MQTFSEEQASVLLSSPARKEELQRCDVGAFVFDGTYPDTFRVAVRRGVGGGGVTNYGLNAGIFG